MDSDNSKIPSSTTATVRLIYYYHISIMRLLFFCLMLVPTSLVMSQGCSDAGFCTMGAMKPDQTYSKKIDFKLRSFELNYYHGKTKLTPVITMYNAELNFGINEKYSFQFKVPYQTVSGKLGDTQGVGDLSFSFSRGIVLENGFNLGLTLGGKIATGRSDIEANNSPFGSGDLPMYYQISLGTHDLVAGASIINDNWLFATGIQIPVIHQNENDFRWGKWPDYPSPKYIKKYDLANDLKRGTDVMLRAERNFRFINFNYGLGLLAIYRITRDERLDFNTDKRIKPEETTGLVLNLLANFGYNFNINHSVKLIGGLKLMDRDLNPDGLTRKHVISTSYVYRF